MTVCYWCGAKDTLADVGKELDNGKYKMVQCRKCKNAYYVVNREKMKNPKPMTNEEWLRICSTEEFAEWIASEINERVKLALHDSELNDGDVDADFYMEDSDDWKEWLKQPHTQGDAK